LLSLGTPAKSCRLHPPASKRVEGWLPLQKLPLLFRNKKPQIPTSLSFHNTATSSIYLLAGGLVHLGMTVVGNLLTLYSRASGLDTHTGAVLFLHTESADLVFIHALEILITQLGSPCFLGSVASSPFHDFIGFFV